MKTHLPLALLVLALQTSPLPAAVTEAEWLNEAMTPEERTALVERSKEEPFDKIAPIVLKAFAKYTPFYGINPRGATPWNDERRRPEDAIYLMAQAVWNHHVESKPKDDFDKAKVLLTLLKTSSNDREKGLLIHAMKHYQWLPEDELALRDLCRDEEQHLELRTRAAENLLYRGDMNIHLPLALELVMQHQGVKRCQAFVNTTNLGYRLDDLTEQNRQALVTAAFTILEELPEKDLQSGYFVARHVGRILKRKDEFAPDQRAERYQGRNGLAPEFFIDTVKNALAWHKENKEDARDK